MTAALSPSPATPLAPLGPLALQVHRGPALDSALARLRCAVTHPALDLAWLPALRDGLGHEPLLLEAQRGDHTVGLLPLALVSSRLFGRFLVSLPYVNSTGLQTTDADAASPLLDRAVALADELNVRHLELRQESETPHPRLTEKNDSKMLLRLELPATADALWSQFKSKLRSQIRSGEKHGLEVLWGQHERLDEFYAVFSRNMRDLGTPVYPRRLFAEILRHFGERAELCVVRLQGRPVAAALLTHGTQTTEVPSASSLRQYNSTSANMVLYWHLLQRAIERGQQVFDFGRSTADSNTYRFKRQWGAEPFPSVWQYYVRRGSPRDLRPEHSRFRLAISLWRRLPLPVANWLGPHIVRGIP